MTMTRRRFRQTATLEEPLADPDVAYEVTVCERPKGWLQVTRNGIPVHTFPPDAWAGVARYLTDPAYRRSLAPREASRRDS